MGSSNIMKDLNVTEVLKKKLLCCIAKSPKNSLALAWFSSLLLVFVAFIAACVAASRMKSGSADKVVSFAAIWTVLVLCAFSVLGTLVLNKFRTSIAIGFLLGVIFILSNQMLILFAFFVDRAHRKKNNSMSHSEAEKAFAAFSFMIFVIYTIFGIMLAVFRIEVIKQVDLAPDDEYSNPATSGAVDSGARAGVTGGELPHVAESNQAVTY